MAADAAAITRVAPAGGDAVAGGGTAARSHARTSAALQRESGERCTGKLNTATTLWQAAEQLAPSALRGYEQPCVVAEMQTVQERIEGTAGGKRRWDPDEEALGHMDLSKNSPCFTLGKNGRGRSDPP